MGTVAAPVKSEPVASHGPLVLLCCGTFLVRTEESWLQQIILKRLVSLFIDDFAAWLLNCPVRETQPLNVELAADILATDQVFRVTLADGRDLVCCTSSSRGAAVIPPCPGGCWSTCPGWP